MKSTLKSYSISLIFILFSTFIFSLLLTILKQNDLINLNTSNIISNILSLLLFFIAAVILGMKIKKKGLINGIILSIIYIAISLIIGFNFKNIYSTLKFISKILLIILGTIIGVNLKK